MKQKGRRLAIKDLSQEIRHVQKISSSNSDTKRTEWCGTSIQNGDGLEVFCP